MATHGTSQFLADNGIPNKAVNKVSVGRPHVVDAIKNSEIQLIINTPTRKGAHTDEGKIRAMAVRRRVPMITTVTGARAAVQAIAALKAGAWSVAAVQDYARAAPLLHSPSHA